MKAAVRIAITLLVAGCVGQASQAQTPASTPTLTILHINDHHSHLDESPFTLPAELVGRKGKLQGYMGGFARVATGMRELAPQSSPVVRIHAGDAITGDLHYLLSDGEADARLMNVVCFDTFTLGNHEFDHGDAKLKSFLDKLAAGPCDTAVLSSNVRFGPDSALHARKAEGMVRPSVVLQRQGMTIGLIGATAAEKTQHSSRPDPGTVFQDERQAVQNEIDTLRAQGVNHIILQTHVGYAKDLELARSLSGVDVIVGGDSHSLLGPPSLEALGFTPEAPYPTLERDQDGNKVCIVQAWQYARVIGRLEVDFDDKGQVVDCRGAPQLLVGKTYSWNDKPLSPGETKRLLGELMKSGSVLPTAADENAEELLKPYRETKQRFGNEAVAHTATPLCLRRIPGRRFDTARSTLGNTCNADPHVIAHGGDVQQWVAHAFLLQSREYVDVDFSLINGGSVRIDIPAGPISATDVYTALPFQNTLVRLTITGSELRDTLEQLVERMFARRSSGGYPYASGLSWEIDLNESPGKRFKNISLVMGDGSRTPIDDGKYYRLVTTSFLAEGSDGYDLFASIGDDRRLDVGWQDAEVLLKHLQSLAPAASIGRLPTMFYSTQRFTDLR